MKQKDHIFMPGQTVTAVIKLHNRYDVTKEEMTELLQLFKEANPNPVIRPGYKGRIPILERHQS